MLEFRTRVCKRGKPEVFLKHLQQVFGKKDTQSKILSY